MNLSSNVNFLLGLQSQMKICHWRTKGIARHEAFGNFYDDLTPLIDDFVEQSMGKYGRFTLEDETGSLQLEQDQSSGQPNFFLNEEATTTTTVATQSTYAQNLDLDTEAGFDTQSVADDILDFTERNPFGEID